MATNETTSDLKAQIEVLQLKVELAELKARLAKLENCGPFTITSGSPMWTSIGLDPTRMEEALISSPDERYGASPTIPFTVGPEPRNGSIH